MTPWTVHLPGYSVHGILQARILEWFVVPSSKGSFLLRDQTPPVKFYELPTRATWKVHRDIQPFLILDPVI